MKPIFILAMVAISAGVIGAGSLNNDIVLTLQDFGVGSEVIVSPIDAASISYIIEAVPSGIVAGEQVGELKNLITACEFQSEEAIAGDYTIICKLTTLPEGTVVAEGRALGSNYIAGTTLIVPIDTLAYTGANAVTNIHDTTLIVMEKAVAAPVNGTSPGFD